MTTENTIDEIVEGEGVHTTETPDEDLELAGAQGEDGDTFPRDYVEKLRDENAKYRQRASDRDDVAARLHTALVAATGRLQDPSDLAFDEDHLRDPAKMIEAVDTLLEAKPHLASRKPTGDIGQGVTPSGDDFSLSAMLKSNAS